jgi:hypothetical protein
MLTEALLPLKNRHNWHLSPIKDKVAPVHPMKAYRQSRGTALLLLETR